MIEGRDAAQPCAYSCLAKNVLVSSSVASEVMTSRRRRTVDSSTFAWAAARRRTLRIFSAWYWKRLFPDGNPMS